MSNAPLTIRISRRWRCPACGGSSTWRCSPISEDAAREQLRHLAVLGEDEEAMREIESLPPDRAETS